MTGDTRPPRGTSPPGKREDCVKLMMAVIRPAKLDETRDVLSGLGIQGLTVTEVRGFGSGKPANRRYRRR